MDNKFRLDIENRRSIYAINKEVKIEDKEIEEILKHSLKFVPSAFNSQSARTVLLLGEHHDRLWDITKEILRGLVPAEAFGQTEEKMDSFKNGYGTVLFFEDHSIIEDLQNRFALYKDNFPVWSEQSSGMLQFVIWTQLEAAGLGASLQHYNPLIDQQVKAQWALPAHWKLIAQMPFGNPFAPAQEKEFLPVEDRIKVFR